MSRKDVIISRLKKAARMYFQESTLHGLRYITQNGASVLRSTFWVIIFITSATLCSILIYSQLQIFQKNRITTTISSTTYPVWKVPFPAVTICDFNIVHSENIASLKEILLNNHISEVHVADFFSNLPSLLNPDMSFQGNISNYIKIIQILRYAGYGTQQLLQQLFRGCHSMISNCFWKASEVDCKTIFKISTTTLGYCCSFNYAGVSSKTTLNTTALYVAGVGPSFGLKVQLNSEITDNALALKRHLGVLIHGVNDFPDMSQYIVSVGVGYEVIFSIKPQIVESDNELQSMDLSIRDCVFENDVVMERSNKYSFSTCIVECKAKAIVSLCGCAPFYYPITGMRICTILDAICLKKNAGHFEGNEWINQFLITKNLSNTRKQALGDVVSCNCYPKCNDISYQYQLNDQLMIGSESTVNQSVINVYFGEASCMKINRSVFLTWQSILASIGGLIGLCLGGSILSVIELIFHICNALFSNYKTKHGSDSHNLPQESKIYWSDFKSVRR